MSNIDYYTTAVSIGDLKNGMLYFDKLIPVVFSVDFAKELANKDINVFGDVLQKVGKEFFPFEMMTDKNFADDLIELNLSGYNMFSKLLINHFNLPKKIPGVSSKQYDKLEDTFAINYFNFINKHNLGDFPLVSAKNNNIASLPDNDDTSKPAILTLANLKLIDASNASWEQIIELRKDPTAKIKLRKLRLFAYENYNGKSKNYIEDDIHSKIYEYENTAKKFGLEIFQATMNNVIGSKMFTGVVTGSILSTIFAAPPISIITASAGAIIELGQITLEFKKQKYEFQNLIKDNPTSFITYYKEKLKNE
jgi:hypothetical protein